jgi:hypothetical protein
MAGFATAGTAFPTYGQRFWKIVGVAVGVCVESAWGGDARAAVNVRVEEGQDAVYAIEASCGIGLGAAVVRQAEPVAGSRIR